MRKSLLIASLLAVGIGALALYMIISDPKREDKKDPVPVENEETTEVEEASAGTGTMMAILARGENLECTISYYQSGVAPSSTRGTYYTSQNRMRGDFVVEGIDEDIVSSMILNEQVLYSWSEIEGEKYGMKVSLNDLEASQNDEEAPTARQVVPLEAEVTYECKPWEVDGQLFEPPTDVIFRDFSAVMDVGMEYGTIY